MLDELGGRVMILELQGYIFFGTSNLLLNRIRARLGNQPVPSHILLDFRRVTGIDSSVSLSLDKLIQYAQAYNLMLITTGLAPSLRSAFERLETPKAAVSRIRIFSDMDHGLEFAENRLLAMAAAGGLEEETLERQLILAGGEPHEVGILMGWLDRRTYAAGEKLISQGDKSDDIFYVERGAVTVQLVVPGGRVVRLRTMGAGTVVGEIAVYLHLPRSASVVAIEETVAVRLSAETLAVLRRENPSGAALLHAYMARQLAEKLLAATRQLGAAQS
jgi:SulP family sulfate permease